MNQQIKQLRLIGLARRAGAVAYGAEGTIDSIKRKKAKLIIFANDISERTKNDILKNINNTCVLELAVSMEELGNAIGVKPVGVIAVTDGNFKKGILEVKQFD